MMHVFISYSRMDRNFVSEIETVLKEEHIQYFLDEKNIEWGGEITNTIEDAISNDITHVIVVISPASLKSHWVSYEIGYAKASGVKILPFLTHPAIDLPLFLSKYNYIVSIEQLRNYFAKSNILRKKMNIIKEDGTEEEVELLLSFKFNDSEKEYAIYTKNEYDENGNVEIYVNSVERKAKGEKARLGGVLEEDWPRVKSVLNELAQNDKNSIWNRASVYDADGVEIL